MAQALFKVGLTEEYLDKKFISCQEETGKD